MSSGVFAKRVPQARPILFEEHDSAKTLRFVQYQILAGSSSTQKRWQNHAIDPSIDRSKLTVHSVFHLDLHNDYNMYFLAGNVSFSFFYDTISI